MTRFGIPHRWMDRWWRGGFEGNQEVMREVPMESWENSAKCCGKQEIIDRTPGESNIQQ